MECLIGMSPVLSDLRVVGGGGAGLRLGGFAGGTILIIELVKR